MQRSKRKSSLNELNPADVGSRGCSGNKIPTIWFSGLEWLSDQEKWPLDIETRSTDESEVEAKPIKDIFKASIEMGDQFDEILERETHTSGSPSLMGNLFDILISLIIS